MSLLPSIFRSIPYLSNDPYLRWGNWVYSRGEKALYLMQGDHVAYEVPVAKIGDGSDDLLGWIDHVAQKVEAEDLGHFVQAFRAVKGFPHVSSVG